MRSHNKKNASLITVILLYYMVDFLYEKIEPVISQNLFGDIKTRFYDSTKSNL